MEGLFNFFCNWGYSAYLLALEGLEQIDAPATKSLLMDAFSVIGKYQNDKRLKKLWDIPSILSDKDGARLEELDEKYWEDEESIMEKMLGCFSEKH